MSDERIRVDLGAGQVPASDALHQSASGEVPQMAADPVADALRAQHLAWKLRDALTTSDWCRYQRGYAVMLAERGTR
jgi:hypothetical protein